LEFPSATFNRTTRLNNPTERTKEATMEKLSNSAQAANHTFAFRSLAMAIILGTTSVVGATRSHGATVTPSRPRVAFVKIAGKSAPSFFDGPGGVNGTATFDLPYGLAYDPTGDLYVADVNNNAIRRIDTAGNVTTAAGTGAVGFVDGPAGPRGKGGTATFNKPVAVASDRAGNLYITDSGNRAIRKLDRSGNVTTVAGTGKQGFVDGNVATSVRPPLFTAPHNIVVDSQGSLFVEDSGRIRKVDIAGNVTTLNTSPGVVLVDDNQDLAIDSADFLYTFGELGTPDGTYLVKKLDPSGNTVATWDFRSGPALSSDGRYRNYRRLELRSLAVDRGGNVFVTSASGNFFMIAPNGEAFEVKDPDSLFLIGPYLSFLPVAIGPSNGLTLTLGNSIFRYDNLVTIPLKANQVTYNPAPNEPKNADSKTVQPSTSIAAEATIPQPTSPTTTIPPKPELCSIGDKLEDYFLIRDISPIPNIALEFQRTFELKQIKSFQAVVPKALQSDWKLLVSGRIKLIAGLSKINRKQSTNLAREKNAYRFDEDQIDIEASKPYFNRLDEWFTTNCGALQDISTLFFSYRVTTKCTSTNVQTSCTT
jgi:streptogramin lyase